MLLMRLPLAGGIAQTIVFPIDLAKTRWQFPPICSPMPAVNVLCAANTRARTHTHTGMHAKAVRGGPGREKDGLIVDPD
jgi:hypothetical protein